ncbi:MAG: hypothetical protein CVT73_17630, partial [Alphaproteobacteria bacterium HGW-Alphaproteobacteria-12]
MVGTAGFAMLPAAPARADTSWTGAADSDWHNAANWSSGVPSDTGNDAYVTGPVTPIINQAATGERWTWIGNGSTDGSLSIVSGGSLTAGCCFYLGSGGTTGTMTVDGTGVLTASDIFVVGGYSSTGHLTIQNGGTVNSGSSTLVGRASGSSGYITVTGENSLWSVSSSLRIAGDSTSSMTAFGSVTLSDSGILRSSGNIIIGNAANSTAFLNIGAAEGDAAVAAGSVDAGNVVFGAGNGELVFNHTETDYIFSQNISGVGEVRQIAGTTNLTGSNSWAGSTVIESGILRAGVAGSLSANSAYTVNGGTLDLNDFTLSISALAGTGGEVDLGSASLAAGSGNTDTSFAGVIKGTGGFEKTGTGILTLTGFNTYSGGTTISGGTLKGNTTSLVGNILNNATLAFDQTTTGTFFDDISGTGSFVKLGAGTLTLTGLNTYLGGTTVSAGTLRSGGGMGLASGAYKVDGGTLDLNNMNLSMSGLSGSAGGEIDLGNAELEVNQFEDSIFGGIISGAGSLVKMGSGILALTGANTYSGGTTVSAGTLKGNTTSLAGDILNNATLAFDQAADGTFSDNVSGTGGLEKTGAGTLTLSGTNTHSGGTTVEAGILRAGGASAFASGAYTVNGGTLDLNDFNLSMSALSGTGGEVDLGSAELEVDQDSDSIFGGIVSGAGSLVKMGSGILALTGANTYSGGTTVSAGTLKGDTTSLAGDIVNNATLAFDQATD